MVSLMVIAGPYLGVPACHALLAGGHAPPDVLLRLPEEGVDVD